MQSFQIQCRVGIRQPAPGEGQTWLNTMAPNSTDKFRIFTHEKGCDSSGSCNWSCSCSKLKRIAHQHPLVSVEPTHISFICLLSAVVPVHHHSTLLLPCQASCLFTHIFNYSVHFFECMQVLVSSLSLVFVRVFLWVYIHVHVFTYM